MTSNMSEDYVFKPGDRVELVVEVVRVGAKGIPYCEVQFSSDSKAFCFGVETLRHGKLLPRVLKVGDKMRPIGSAGIATIIAIDSEDVWVRWPDGTKGIWCLTDLELVV